MKRLVAIIVVLGLARFAGAHPLDLGYLSIASDGDRVSVHLDLDIGAAAIALETDTSALDATTVQARAVELATKTFARAPITTERGPCLWTGATATLAGRTVSIADIATCPGTTRSWAFPIVARPVISPRFQLMVKESSAGSERLTLVDKTSPELKLAMSAAGAPSSSSVGFTHFVWAGIEHIGAAPDQWISDAGGLKLPDGIDHILFLLALMLGGGTLLQLVAIASGFTVGHSITLALAALDIVRPPASIIEPLIALSIALAAVEAYSGRFKSQRWKIACFFGLIHGFGFASALGHLDLTTRGKLTALFGFNAGVELGQVIIVLVAAPLVMLAHRKASIGQPATKIAAIGIFVAGIYWFVVRAFG